MNADIEQKELPEFPAAPRFLVTPHIPHCRAGMTVG
jgi:hypothetical protein